MRKNNFTPLEKATDKVGGGKDIAADGGLMPPSAGTVRERSSLTGFTQRVIIILSSVFYIGYSPFLAGTMASLAAFLVDILIIKANVILHLGIVCCVSFIGFLVSGKAEKLFGQKDAREIVIDDFNGVLVGLLFLPYSLKISILGFVIFRIMDGLKPYPIYKMEKLKGSWGVMGDDLVAGVYTNIVLQLLCALLSCR